MPNPSFDDLPGLVGRTFGPSPYRAVDQARIDAFAAATDDPQWIHVDPERAARGPFGTTVAHGYLTLALLVPMVADLGLFPDDARLVVNYGLDKARFPAPVPSGARVRVTARLNRVEPKGEGRLLLALGCEVELEGTGTPALVADVLYLVVRG